MAESYKVELTDYRGRHYRDFHARRSASDGPGWYVFGRNPHHYGGNLVMLVARPEVEARKHPHYNVRVRRGFRTMREAREVAAILRAQHSDPCPATEESAA